MAIPPSLVEVSPARDGLLRLTYNCMLCDKPNQIDVDARLYALWRSGTAGHVQDVFTTMSDSEREVLISGSHAKCYDEAFREDEEGSTVAFIEPQDGVDYTYVSPFEDHDLPPWLDVEEPPS